LGRPRADVARSRRNAAPERVRTPLSQRHPCERTCGGLLGRRVSFANGLQASIADADTSDRQAAEVEAR